METIIAAFHKAGINVEVDSYTNDDGERVTKIMLDDYPRSHRLIDLVVGVNAYHRPAVFGEYWTADNSQTYSLSGSICDWLENFGKYLPKIAKGEHLW